MLTTDLNRTIGTFAAALLLAACGGDTSAPDEDSMEATADDDTAPADDSAPADDATDDDATDDDVAPEPTPVMADPAADDPPFEMTPTESLPAGAYECTYDRVPNEQITDFTLWAGGEWGDDVSLTGGSFGYQNDSGGAEALTVEVDAMTATAHLTGTVVGYAGWGLWFGPCTNASRWQGIRFVMGGDLGETGQLEFQVQTNNNYPIDTSNTKGACAGDWGDGCDNNSVSFEEFPAEPSELTVAWEELSGGAPNAVEPAELLGIQWQFNCADSCELDVTIEEVSFY